MEVLKQLRKRFENVNNSVSKWAVGLMFLFMVAAPIELEAQSGLKISSLAEVTDYGKDVIQLEQRMAELAAADAARTKKHHERHAAAPEH